MTDNEILRRLPPLVQDETGRDQLGVVFDSDTDVYLLPKAPVLEVHEVTGISGGEETTFVEGTDYKLLDHSNGNPEKIDWSLSGDDPDDGTEFVVDETFRTIIDRYTAAHDEEFDFLESEIKEAIESHEVEQASGKELDRIGALFGQLGKRRGRDDTDYRIYLQSIVDSFQGRGSLQGLKFAIASSIGADPDDIVIVERFDQLEYDVQVFNVSTGFISSAINDLAELADPSVVQLGQAIIVIAAGGVNVGADSSTVTSSKVGLCGGTLTLDGNSTLT